MAEFGGGANAPPVNVNGSGDMHDPLPGTQRSKLTFSQFLNCVMHKIPADVSTPAQVKSTTTVTDPAIGKRKELVAEKQTRATAKGLCCIEWGQQHEGGTNSQFETFWKKLDLAERQKYANKLAVAKTATGRLPNHEPAVAPLNMDASILEGVLEDKGAAV
ncbi:hypothetical protein EDB19DRAFT_1702380 [Suillus lakei]|nr:hypothetical protein EDB19DRAFT_1702380 [Suillus lakei]